MSNEELKKKIVKELNKLQDYGYMCRVTYNESTGEGCGISHQVTNERIADALIAAGIVDKSDYASMKETAVRYKAEVSKAGARVKEAEAEANRYEMLYKLQNRDMALAERRAHDAEHRAARAERALYNACCEQNKHWCVQCDSFAGCDTSNEMCIEAKKHAEELIKQAEKELAEEGK